MRILVAHSFYRQPGGEDRFVRQQVELLSQRHTVALLERQNTELEGGVQAAARMVYSPSERDRVGREIGRFRPDVVHLHNAYPSLGPSAHLAARTARAPLVMTVHNHRLRCPNGLMFTEESNCRRCENGAYHNAVLHDCFASRSQAAAYAAALWSHRFVARLERMVSVFVAVSEFMGRQLVDWGLPEDRVVVARNFTDHPPSPAPGSPGTYGLFAGRLSAEKGVDVLLEALDRAGDPPFKVVGDGPARDALRRRGKRLGLARTEWLGRVDPSEIPRLVRASRFVAVPSLWQETSCLSGIEGLAGGRPLLVTALGALPELVATGAGLIAAPGDAGDLAAKIRRLMDDDDFCREAGRRGAELAAAEFGPQRHLAAIEAAYERALSQAP